MFKWFMAKTLVSKIIIVTSSVVVIGGATASAIIIPKQIEMKKEEQRQEQIRLENEQDLANMNIVLKTDYISMPLNGVTQGFSIERYYDLEEVVPVNAGDEINKEQMTKVLTDIFIESYTGGELSVEYDSNINTSTRGDYPITFKVTSEKGNTKTATAKITVWNYFKVSVDIPKTEITITKGTNVDLMKGVSFTSNLPKEEQGHIETSGTVDVNKVGTYTITYTYIPKEGTNEGAISPQARTYKVIEKTSVEIDTPYYSKEDNITVTLVFTSASKFKYTTTYSNGADGGTTTGTYSVKGNKVNLKSSDWGEKHIIINNNNNSFYLDPAYTVYDLEGP